MEYKIIVDKQSRTNPSNEKREYKIDIEELRVKGDVYDSLIITKDEDYVMRRLSLSEYHVLKVLDEPIKEPLPNINIELFEGENYIYLLDMEGNKFYAEYLVKNEFNDTYVIKSELNSAIESTAKSIELSVNQKLESYSTTEEMNTLMQLLSNSFSVELNKKVNGEDITGAYLMLLINGDTSEAKLNADKVQLTANDILNIISNNILNLTARNIAIASNNFNVDNNGNVTISAALGNEEGANPSFKIKKDDYNYTEFYATKIRTFLNGNSVFEILPFHPWIVLKNAQGSGDYTNISAGSVLVGGSSSAKTDISAGGITTPSLAVTGSKNRAVKIDDNSYVLLNAYETATPYFGDIGSNKTDDKGYCKIEIENVFKETVELEDYKVFIQECGEGRLYVKKQDDYFEVFGTPNLEFDWEIKAIQKGYKDTRLTHWKNEINKEASNGKD